ncbi:extracellular solute-binding protein [Streptomyces spiramenti]|uniref:Extracellular solute-binding protein n=1 Tax=Streptomyces spiramenti TaxID=2720606 RepID=A0ABX1AUR7_9ACTN|nr:extracellular solute-binding protein [Streptomyces spiramenti]NJP69193.1 extracellular solute-binding protein [Streptomyces spiramenti]
MGRRLGLGAAAVALALPVAGCGGAGGDPADTTLRLWVMEGTSPEAGPWFEELRAVFRERTGAGLEYQLVPWDQAHDKLTTAAAGDALPDVSEIGTTWVPEFAAAAIVADVTEEVAATGLDGDLLAGVREAGTLDGRLHGMPWYAGVRALYYRADVFAEHGLEPPATWDELVAVGKELREQEPEMIPYPVPGASEHSFYPYLWGAGGEVAVVESGGWRSALNSPEAIEGIGWFTGLATEHGLSVAAADTWTEADTLQSFRDGRAAMVLNGSWAVGNLLREDASWADRLGVVPVPGQEGGISPSFAGGSLVSVIEGTDHPELAWSLVELMTTGEFADRWTRDSGFFPARQSLLAGYAASDDPHVAPFARQLADAGKHLPVSERFGEVQAEQVVQRMLLSVLSGDRDVEAAAAEATEAMDRILRD